MSKTAYACVVSLNNRGAIASESRSFNAVKFEEFLSLAGPSYFIRDEGSPFDCEYMAEQVFNTIYAFERGGEGDLFRPIIMIGHQSK